MTKILNEDTGHIVCWATSVKHKKMAQQRNLFLLLIIVGAVQLLHLWSFGQFTITKQCDHIENSSAKLN